MMNNSFRKIEVLENGQWRNANICDMRKRKVFRIINTPTIHNNNKH